mgnify:FL=1|tara:strand:- start:828 stop:3758 length:2931 start_codon:yes stop_codon:yes gene_type:complete
MSIDKYRFVSPGVQIKEIDQSRRTEPAADPGPVIIGRFQKGVTMRPVKVDSLSELQEIFGNTITGRETVDASRNGNYSAPSYAGFAANAWLANNGGATIIRLAGKQNINATAGTGEAGWTNAALSPSIGRGGAWGLWVIPSGSSKEMTGTLGAIFYCEGDTGVVLSGALAGNSSVNVQAGMVGVKSTTGNLRAKVITSISENSSSVAGTEDEDVSFNFNPSSRNFIRKVFNTTPHNTNSEVIAATAAESKKYWLGETFEDSVQELMSSVSSTTDIIAFTAPLFSGSHYYYDHSYDAQSAKTGWIFSQDTSTDHASYLATNMQKLFRFRSLEEGEWTQRNLKVSIQNIRVPNLNANPNAYGSFDVVIRSMKDTDANPQVVEIYPNCNLNPASPNFIAAQIGDQRAVWNDNTKRYQYYGTYPNMSKYFYVEMASAVEEGTVSNELVPFGFYGLPKPASVTISGRGTGDAGKAAYIGSFNGTALRTHDATVIDPTNNFQIFLGSDAGTGASALTASLQWPDPKLVISASSNTQLADPTDIFFGYEFTRHGTSTLFDESTYDLLKSRNKSLSSNNWDTTGNMIYSHYFSLDDVSGSSTTTITAGGAGFIYKAGSRALGTSWTKVSGTQGLIDAGYDKFTLPFYGGFDGLEVKEMEPLINNRASTPVIGTTVEASYELNTLRRAIDTVADPELVDMNLLVLPGVTNTSVTDHMINTCEARADSMAIIDIPNAWTPRHESNDGSQSERNVSNTVARAVSDVRRKGYNSSYAATYYPWVQIREPISGLPTWCPPSVVALGAMSYGDRTQAPWFAPAGFTRGGLSEGRGGVPVIAVSQRLTSKQRDSLYENNINPIAHFPAEGIVIFGQKTLQADPTALDRINVRRLLIFLKKRISNIAATLLFEPNVTATFGRFLSQARPLLTSVQTGFGIEDFKIVLDSTTTTPDLVDRNIMYAKIFIKPTKAIEFIAIDFVITNQGASFDD